MMDGQGNTAFFKGPSLTCPASFASVPGERLFILRIRLRCNTSWYAGTNSVLYHQVTVNRTRVPTTRLLRIFPHSDHISTTPFPTAGILRSRVPFVYLKGWFSLDAKHKTNTKRTQIHNNHNNRTYRKRMPKNIQLNKRHVNTLQLREFWYHR